MPVVFSLFLGLLVSTVPLAEPPVSFQQVMERSTATADEIILAIETLTEHRELGYQPQSFALVGHSAGGHLALLASQLQRRLPIRGRLYL